MDVRGGATASTESLPFRSDLGNVVGSSVGDDILASMLLVLRKSADFPAAVRVIFPGAICHSRQAPQVHQSFPGGGGGASSRIVKEEKSVWGPAEATELGSRDKQSPGSQLCEGPPLA